MEWLNNLLSYISSGVSFSHPVVLLSLVALGLVSEIGMPLFFALEIFLFYIAYDFGPLSTQALLTIFMLLLGREAGANLLYLVTDLLGGRFLNWLGKRSPRTLRAVVNFRARLFANLIICSTSNPALCKLLAKVLLNV